MTTETKTQRDNNQILLWIGVAIVVLAVVYLLM